MRLSSFRFLLALSVRSLGILAIATLLSYCSSPQSPEVAMAPASAGTHRSYSTSGSDAESISPAKSRPGLGTQLGREIHDDSTSETFYRKSGGVPDGVNSFHYNDKEGAELMAKLVGDEVRHGQGSFELIPDKLRVAVMSGYWRSSDKLGYFRSGKEVYVIGAPGHAYSLKLENLTSDRMEAVVSVDGLDLLDGQPASVKKRGYVIPAKSAVLIQGMRVNGKLFSLKFGSVSQSRASTAFGEKGARNVGVIGVAYYAEDSQARRRAQVAENYVRQGASAFGN